MKDDIKKLEKFNHNSIRMKEHKKKEARKAETRLQVMVPTKLLTEISGQVRPDGVRTYQEITLLALSIYNKLLWYKGKTVTLRLEDSRLMTGLIDA